MDKKKIFLILLTILFVLFFFLPFFGTVKLSFSSILKNETDRLIFWEIRVPRLILGFLAGAILSLSGLLFQNIFKNSLATPYTLGISSGASAGVVIAIKLNLSFIFLGFGTRSIFGFLGAILSIFLIISIAKLVGSFSIYTLLMSGIAINFFFSSLVAITLYLFDFTQTISILRWLLGGIEPVRYSEIIFLSIIFVIFVIIVFIIKSQLIISSIGDEFAISKGLDIKKFRLTIFFIVSIVIGILVTRTGPIGFVGLIVPHISRLIFKNDIKLNIIITMILGGLFLGYADFIARILIPPVEIPVGIITSLIGAPFFIFVLITSLRNNRD